MSIEKIRKTFDANCKFCAVRLNEWEEMEKEVNEAYDRMNDGLDNHKDESQSSSKNSISDANLSSEL